MHALYNPLNISALATELSVPCPPGYSSKEMRARSEETDICVYCGATVLRYKGPPNGGHMCHL